MPKEMNAKQEARLNMQRATEQLIDDNQEIVSTNTAFVNAFNRVKTNIAAVRRAAEQKSADRTGIAADKAADKQNLCQLADKISGYIYAFAANTSNNTLKTEMNTTYAKLLRTRDEELPPRCQLIHTRGTENLADLRDFGVNAALLTQLQTAIDRYSAATPKPRAAVSQRKTNTVNIARLLDENDGILNSQLDNLIEHFRPDHQNFVEIYFNIRQVVEPATRPKKPKNNIKNKKI